jgi:hypothetical protein
MTLPLSVLAGWLLLAATIISVTYELWRAVARTNVGPSDTMRAWISGLPLYAGALAASLLLLLGWEFAPLLGLAFGLLASGMSIFWYGPSVLCQRRPGALDWFEDRVFTMLVGIVALLLTFELAGITLAAG